NVPVAFASCMQMLAPGGRFVAVTIANNWCGHGFYQFSPELFYRVFNKDAGFSIVEIYAADEHGERHYAIADPAIVGARVQIWSCDPMYLLVHARRDQVRPVLTTPPNQADYVSDWAGAESVRRRSTRAAWKELPGVRELLRVRARRYWRRQRREAMHD